jgi:hypothetical protein
VNFVAPWASLAGGVTIGLAAAALLLLAGRTLGVSGIFYGALSTRGPEFRWRATFLLGLLAAPTVLKAIAAIMPKTERKSRIGQWFARAFKGLKYVRAPLSLITVAWHLARMV